MQLRLCWGAETAAQVGCNFAVAGEAEGAEIIEVALAAAFGYGEDVVGVPEGTAGGDGFEAPEGEGFNPGLAAGALELGVGGEGVGGTEAAETAVAGKDEVAEVGGVGAETPLVDAVAGAEGAAAGGEDFELAPAAERQAVGAEREMRGLGTTGFGESALVTGGHCCGGALWTARVS